MKLPSKFAIVLKWLAIQLAADHRAHTEQSGTEQDQTGRLRNLRLTAPSQTCLGKRCSVLGYMPMTVFIHGGRLAPADGKGPQRDSLNVHVEEILGAESVRVQRVNVNTEVRGRDPVHRHIPGSVIGEAVGLVNVL